MYTVLHVHVYLTQNLTLCSFFRRSTKRAADGVRALSGRLCVQRSCHVTSRMRIWRVLSGWRSDMYDLRCWLRVSNYNRHGCLWIGETVAVNANAAKWRRCVVEPHPGNPPLQNSVIHIGYPRGELYLPVAPALTLLTNQPRIQLRYELTSKTGTRIVSRNQMEDIEDGGRILLGGQADQPL